MLSERSSGPFLTAGDKPGVEQRAPVQSSRTVAGPVERLVAGRTPKWPKFDLLVWSNNRFQKIGAKRERRLMRTCSAWCRGRRSDARDRTVSLFKNLAKLISASAPYCCNSLSDHHTSLAGE